MGLYVAPLFTHMQERLILYEDLGFMPYADAKFYQEELQQQLISNKKKYPEKASLNHFLFVEHPPVYTLGKSGKEEHLLVREAELKAQGASFFRTDRGGDITYHGPGQIVGYPILDLDFFFKDIHKYIRYLEEVIIRTLQAYGLKGERSAGETGVWLDVNTPRARKLCAIGIRVSRWVTVHGFALNVNTDLSRFNAIVPCGIRGKGVSSLQAEIGHRIPEEEVKALILKHFEEVFEARFIEKF